MEDNMKRLISIAAMLLLFTSSALAQDFCKGDHDYDGDCDSDDVTSFLEDFGRSQFNNPCPPDGPTPVPKTGQTTSYATGDDGDLERGVELVTPRFNDNGDGTVTDNQTGLIWMKDAYCFVGRDWSEALSDCNALADGQCGLTDGSSAEDWRLPNINELASLIHKVYYHPVVPNTSGTGKWTEGDPFNNVQSSTYWSSTTYDHSSDLAWYVGMSFGIVDPDNKAWGYYVWCVRGGH